MIYDDPAIMEAEARMLLTAVKRVLEVEFDAAAQANVLKLLLLEGEELLELRGGSIHLIDNPDSRDPAVVPAQVLQHLSEHVEEE